jgi:sodium transport system permease protein
MHLSSVLPIYRKEMLDMARDRRTMISMVLVPLVSMPLLFLLMGKFMNSAGRKAEEASATIAVQDADRLPGLLNALSGAGFKLLPRRDLKAAIESTEIAAGVEPVVLPDGTTEVRIYADLSRQPSQVAATKIRAALDAFKENSIRLKLIQLGVPESVMNPFTVKRVNIAPDSKMGASFWGSLLGYVVVIFMFSGAMYPAIDMTAGEKERRTLEVLLSAPAGRDEIILGKLLATTTSVAVTAALSITSLVFSFRVLQVGDAQFRQMAGHLPLNAHTVALMAVALLPLCVLSASLMIAIALFAKGFKEAQSYLTPLIMAAMFPVVISFVPMQLTPAMALIPLLNVSQMIKEIFMGDFSVLVFMVATTANIAYAAIAFFAAVRIFKDERVLFRT